MRYADRLRMVTSHNVTANGTFDYSLDNSCSTSVVWRDAEPRARVALYAIFIGLFILYIFQWLLIRRRSQQAKKTLFVAYGSAVGFIIVYLVLAIIGDIGYGCTKISPTQYIGIFVAVDVVQSLANLLIMFILLFPLTMSLLRHNFFSITLPRAINATFLLFLTTLCFVQMGVTSYDALKSIHNKNQKNRLEAPLTGAYVSLYLAGAFLVSGYIIATMRPMFKYSTEYHAHLKWSLPALSFSIFCLALVNFIEGLGWTVAHATWTKAISVVFLVLNLVAQAITFETLLMVAGSDTFSAAGEKRGIAQVVMFKTHTGGLDKQREWEMGAQRIKTDEGFMDRTRERSDRTQLPTNASRDPT